MLRPFFPAAFLFTSILFSQAPRATASAETGFDAQVRFVKGDVRVSLGEKGQPRINKNWVQMEPGMDIEQGYSIATQEGNTEIELENGSVIYLAPHSLLTFDELDVTGADDPDAMEYGYVRVRLVAGSAIFYSQFRADGLFSIETPTASLQTNTTALVRVTSYLNGTEVQSLDDEMPEELRETKFTNAGQNKFVTQGGVTVQIRDSDQEGIWQNEVRARLLERFSLTIRALQASGIDAPFGGLEDLYRSGEFAFCGEETTCWRPSAQALQDLPTQAGQVPVGQSRASVSTVQLPPGAKIIRDWDSWEGAACGAIWTRSRLWRDANGKLHYDVQHNGGAASVLSQGGRFAPWETSACTTGYFGYHQGAYWLKFKHHDKHCHHHHHHELHTQWVKIDGRAGLMRIVRVTHNGKTITTMGHTVYLMPAKGKEEIQRVELSSASKLELLERAPKEYRWEGEKSAPKTTEPVINAHYQEPIKAGRSESGALRSNNLREVTFDYAKHGFVIQGAAMGAGAVKPVYVARMTANGGVYAPGGRNSAPGVVTASRASVVSSGSAVGGSHSSGYSGGASAGGAHSYSPPSTSSYTPPGNSGGASGGGGKPH